MKLRQSDFRAHPHNPYSRYARIVIVAKMVQQNQQQQMEANCVSINERPMNYQTYNT